MRRNYRGVIPIKNHNNGFTIVELLIVIVIIAILSALVIATYNGVQQRARDSQRKNDLILLSKGMQLWVTQEQKNPNPDLEGGQSNTGMGYATCGNGTTYPTSIVQVLTSKGFLKGSLKDPQISTCSSGTYMHYYCKASEPGGDYGFFAKLESPSASDLNTYSAWQSNCTTTPSSALGMNYVLRYSLSK